MTRQSGWSALARLNLCRLSVSRLLSVEVGLRMHVDLTQVQWCFGTDCLDSSRSSGGHALDYKQTFTFVEPVVRFVFGSQAPANHYRVNSCNNPGTMQLLIGCGQLKLKGDIPDTVSGYRICYLGQ